MKGAIKEHCHLYRFDGVRCLYKAASEMGLSIAEDISVVGFDDIQLAQLVSPQLTTIRQPIYEMGKEATNMLIKLIDGKRIRKKTKKFSPELIIRESTRRRNGKTIE